MGEPFHRRLGLVPREVFAEEFTTLQDTEPYRLLHRHLADPQKLESLLTGLSGGFVRPGPGGDPVRNPDVPSGRNLAAFEPDKIPTRAAYEAGGDALIKLIDAHRAEHDGATPEKLAFSLWSSEAMRHLGVLESQALHALGLRPVWDGGGRVTALEIVPAAELGRPRIDVVLKVTSVYRDQFDGFMRLLADAIDRLARLDEPGNAVARNAAAIAARLTGRGVDPERARQLASLRLFGNEPGDYGGGLSHAVLDSTHWDHEDGLADAFLDRMQHAYGARDWFERHNPTAQAQVIERMVEAIRRDYWDADAQTRRDLVERWRALERDHGVRIGEPATRDFARAMATGFGLDTASPVRDPGAASATMAETVRGTVMEPVVEPPPEEPSPWRPWAGLAALTLCLSAGAVRQLQSNRPIEI